MTDTPILCIQLSHKNFCVTMEYNAAVRKTEDMQFIYNWMDMEVVMLSEVRRRSMT